MNNSIADSRCSCNVLLMVRRSTQQKKIDESAFPVRVKFVIPDGGLGWRLDDLHRWLQLEVGPGDYALHSTSGLAMDAIGIYLRDVECARALVHAFPDMTLADGTQQCIYTSPAHSRLWQGWEIFGVCNLYKTATAAELMAQLDQSWRSDVQYLMNDINVYPDYCAPVGLIEDGERVFRMMRWGMPSPAFALKNKKTDRGVTNVRNTKSPHWRRWLGVEHRCVVPFTSFSEPYNRVGHPSEPVWFALSDNRPVAFFAGIWARWTSVRKLKDGETTDNLFGFLTTDANEEVGAIHPKAMPVILRTKDEVDQWLTAEPEAALSLQRPLPNGTLELVARGKET